MGPLEAAVVELSSDTLPRLFNPFVRRVQGYGLVSIFSSNPIFVPEKEENLMKSQKSHDALFFSLACH